MKGTKEHPPVDRHPVDVSKEGPKQGMEPIHLVPLVDRPEAIAIYDSPLVRFAFIGAIVGAIVLGMLGWFLASGSFSVANLGQLGSAGPAAATYAASGVGAAGGALVGGLLGLRRIPSSLET